MAVATIVDYLDGLVLPDTPKTRPSRVLAAFRRDFYRCLTGRARGWLNIPVHVRISALS